MLAFQLPRISLGLIVPKTADPKSLVVLLCANSSRVRHFNYCFLRNMEEEVNHKLMDLIFCSSLLGKTLLDGCVYGMFCRGSCISLHL